MRIISKFHDYYDSVMSQGQDFGLLYLRNEEKRDLPPSKWPGKFPHCRANSQYETYSHSPSLGVKDYIIGFCGKIYPVVYLEADIRVAGSITKTDGSKALHSAYCYSLAEIDAFVEKHYKKKHIEDYYSREKSSRRVKNWPYYAQRRDFKEFFEEATRGRDQYANVFTENKCPIFVVKGNSQLVINTSLKQYEFYKKFDSYTAFQELQMFLGNQANPEKPIPHVSDRDLMEGKGFDYKWSFRKEKEK